MTAGRWETPQSWLWVEMQDISEVVGGGTPNASDPSNFDPDGTPWLTPADLSGYKEIYISRGSRNLSAKGLAGCGAKVMPEGAVLFTSRAPIGYVAIAANPIATNQGFKSFVLATDCVPEFFRYYLKSSKAYAESMASGSTFLELSGGRAKELVVPVAPKNEQRRIVAKLDALFDKSRSIREKLDRAPRLLANLQKFVLDAAFRGDLTREWRERRALSFCWERIVVGDVAEVGTGSTPLRSNPNYFSSIGTPWVTSAATGKPYIECANEFVTPLAIKDHRLKLYPPGTLLVAMYGEGKTRGQVSELAIASTINQACAAIQVNESLVLRSFLKYALQANYLEMRALAEGGNQPNLNLSKIKGVSLSVPCLEEQAEIVRKIDLSFASIFAVSSRVDGLAQRVVTLESSVLKMAFSGELVPQDPCDEPASVLLERIRAIRPQSSPRKKKEAVSQ